MTANYFLFGARKKAAGIAVVSVLLLIVAIVLGSRMPRSGVAFLIIIAYRWYAEGAFANRIAARQSEEWTGQS